MAARVDHCESVNRSRAGRCSRGMLFSAIRYSCCKRSCWFTIPVTYANRRATCVLLMEDTIILAFAFQCVRIFLPYGLALTSTSRAALRCPFVQYFGPAISTIHLDASSFKLQLNLV